MKMNYYHTAVPEPIQKGIFIVELRGDFMDERSLRILEWDKIKQQVAEFASFSLGKQLILALEPSANFDEVERNLEQTTQALALLWKHGVLPWRSSGYCSHSAAGTGWRYFRRRRTDSAGCGVRVRREYKAVPV